MAGSKKLMWSNPWIFVPTLYFLQGCPYFVINAISVIIFKKMGIPNDTLLFWLSLIAWPWALKMLWSPVVDSISTKKRWVLGTQVLNALLIFLFGLALKSPSPWETSLLLLGVAAFVSATHDIASDGFYILSLSHEERSFFVGLCSTSFRLSRVFVTGILVWLAGHWESQGMDFFVIWPRVLSIASMVYLVGIVIFYVAMPSPKEDENPVAEKIEWGIFREYFSQKNIFAIVLFILFYRFGESMVSALSSPFLLDPGSRGGLGLNTEQVGQVSGIVGVGALTLGGISGGFVLARWGLKRCLLPMLFSMYVPNLFYLWASIAKPSFQAVYAIVFVDQFGYGFGFSAYMVFMMFIAQASKFKTAHYAISTALMATGATIAGSLSGYSQTFFFNYFGASFGYSSFFAMTFALCIPGLLLLKKLPLEGEDLYLAPENVG